MADLRIWVKAIIWYFLAKNIKIILGNFLPEKNIKLKHYFGLFPAWKNINKTFQLLDYFPKTFSKKSNKKSDTAGKAIPGG